MTTPVRCVAAVAVFLSVAAHARAQQTPEAPLAPNCRTTLVYNWPTGPRHYECCARSELPEVLAPTDEPATSGADGPPESIVRFLADEKMRLDAARQTSCVDLMELTPLERALRQVQATFGSCTRFVVYDHFPCSCENSCGNVNLFVCDCPGVPFGELPETKPQDSLGSQPQLVSEILTPCSKLSTCN